MVREGVRKFQESRNTSTLPVTILLQFVNITIDCIGVKVEAQAQKVYQ